MFEQGDDDKVIRLARELLPASIAAASRLVASDTGLVRDPAGLVADMAGHISRDAAKIYLDGLRAVRRADDMIFFIAEPEEGEDIPPYGEQRGDEAGESADR